MTKVVKFTGGPVSIYEVAMSNPLPLYQVLEEEYTSLHGDLPKAYIDAKQKIENSGPSEAEKNQALVSELYTCIHELESKRTALCLSGGGIRSATFALGVIQGLARYCVLRRFDYLSTVSGGGYIGSWLTAWIHRHSHGLPGVADELKNPPTSTLDPEPEPVQHLRDYSNYLSPKVGILSADTWTLAGTYLRNLLLNWLVLIPLLAAVLMIPRVCVAVIRERPPAWLMNGVLAVGFLLGALAIFYMGLNLPSSSKNLQPRRPFWWARREQGHFLRWCWLPLLGSAVLLTTFWAWYRQSGADIDQLQMWERDPLLIFVLFGAALHILGWLGYSLVLWSASFWEWGISLLTGAVGGWLAWLAATKLFPDPVSATEPMPGAELYVCFAFPLFLSAFLLAATVFVGFISRWTSDEDREWWARSGSWVLIAIVMWSVVSCLVMFGPLAIMAAPEILAPVGGVTGLISLLVGWSSKTAPTEQPAGKSGLAGFIADKALVLAAAVFLLIFATGLSLGTSAFIKWLSTKSIFKIDLHLTELAPAYDLYRHLATIHWPPWWWILTLLVVVVVFGLAMAYLINTNKFSLHAMYRSRLIRAYLGASRKKGDRKPNPFTGFDPKDNIQMRKLWPNRGSKHPSDDRRRRPLHVVNIALNLVTGKELAWQQRKAETFTVSPLHCGNYRLGYRRSEEYGGGKDWQFEKGKKTRAISLGTAVTISGAAASPNMGYHSSPLLTLLMTLFNVRLGWWLGNPGLAGQETYGYSAPKYFVKPLVWEALGLTDDKSNYVYLSDGGHFENLGLYEMVLRRCHTIVVSDASCDPECTFEDLGNAIRKIRIDLGIPIEFKKINIYSRSQNKQGAYCTIGTIGYSAVDGPGTDGQLIYIKPAFYGDEPRDVYQYGQASPTFPHESTADQWFSESQFESYRMLGWYVMEQIGGKPPDECPEGGEVKSFEEFLNQVRQYVESKQESATDDAKEKQERKSH